MTSSYYDTNMNSATRTKAKDVQGHAKRMQLMIEEMGAWAKLTLLPVFTSLFLFVTDLLNKAKNQTKTDMTQAIEAEKSTMMPVTTSLKSSAKNIQSPSSRIAFKPENSATATLLPAKPANIEDRLTKMDVKQLRERIQFRPSDMALKPQANLAKPKEMELAERTARDEDGKIVFLRDDKDKKGKTIVFRTNDNAANTNKEPQSLLGIFLKRRHQNNI